MITKEELEMLKNAENQSQKRQDYEQSMSTFKQGSAEAAERFEKVIDDSLRNRIKYNNEQDEVKRSVIISFKTFTIYQIAALSHVIKKYEDVGFKTYVLERHLTKDANREARMVNPFYRAFNGDFENQMTTKFERSENITTKAVTNQIDNFISFVTRFENYNKVIGNIGRIPDLSFFGDYERAEIKVRDILNGSSLAYVNSKEVNWKCKEEIVIEFTLD